MKHLFCYYRQNNQITQGDCNEKNDFTNFYFNVDPISVNAQSDVHKMLKDIKGTVDEIIIKSDGKEYTFSGDEAAKLFSEMKRDNKMKHFDFITDDGKIIEGDSLNKRFIVKKHGDHFKYEGKDGKKVKKIKVSVDGDEDDALIWIDEDGEMEDLSEVDEFEFFGDNDVTDGKQKRINVEVKDDSKVVTVTTIEDGKENIEVFEGKAAEEYLEKMKSEHDFDGNIDVNKDTKHKKIKKIIIEKEEETE